MRTLRERFRLRMPAAHSVKSGRRAPTRQIAQLQPTRTVRGWLHGSTRVLPPECRHAGNAESAPVPSPITLKKRLAAVELPTTPKGECDAALQKKVWRSRVAAACGLAPTATSQVQDFTEKKRRGLHFVDTLRAHKEFYNPSILETLVDQARSHSHANTKPNTNTNTSESYSRRHLPVLCACVCSWVMTTRGLACGY